MAFSEIERIVASATSAITVEVLPQNVVARSPAAHQAFEEHRVCVYADGAGMIIAAPIKSGAHVFGILEARYGEYADGTIGDYALSELLNATGQVLGNALALAERVPEGTCGVLGRGAYETYLRAHFEIYRSFRVPFTIALFDLAEHGPESRLPRAVELRWTIRKSDAVFEIDDTWFAALLANCQASGAHIAVERVRQSTGINVGALVTPRRGESFRHLFGRCTMTQPAQTEIGVVDGYSRR
jgi:hypothetical protein